MSTTGARVAAWAVVWCLAGAGCATSVLAAEGAGSDSQTSGEKQDSRPARLKFKDGPVCMCVSGLSEKEIKGAESRREKQQTEQSSASEE
jgi:hypothetical protein